MIISVLNTISRLFSRTCSKSRFWCPGADKRGQKNQPKPITRVTIYIIGDPLPPTRRGYVICSFRKGSYRRPTDQSAARLGEDVRGPSIWALLRWEYYMSAPGRGRGISDDIYSHLEIGFDWFFCPILRAPVPEGRILSKLLKVNMIWYYNRK